MGDVQPWPPAGQPGRPQGGGWPGRQPVPQESGYAAMRAAHTDRDRTVDVLKAAFAEGRLDAAEYSARFDAANQAQTYGQLAQIVADLPTGPMPGPAASAPSVPIPPTFLAPPQPPRNNGMAIASLVLGLLCVPTGGILGLPAVITGHVARRQIRETREAGDGMATAGLVMGYLSVAGWAAMLLLAMLIIGTHG
ncbi:DUF1707 and DUF4190 domain-containing protein [Kitasatospora kifunensis]|uniref:DUF4190 domain-containing protein n=1 Tax=Kitasatospora kifunensis TaxID=58351 RepID=A0A7W7R4E6_KITKI|nr:DUF1707 and DUF4190 domain-containing protein [Kitasatospora kifunensis]MBB4925191.1 hypothetical protein [Kitasatospora kifunensis]